MPREREPPDFPAAPGHARRARRSRSKRPPAHAFRSASAPAAQHWNSAQTSIIRAFPLMSSTPMAQQTMKALVKREAAKGIWLEEVKR